MADYQLPATTVLFLLMQMNLQLPPPMEVLATSSVHDDVFAPLVFMLQHLMVRGHQVLIFCDSGCQTMCVSWSGRDVLGAQVVWPGPQ